MSNDVEYDLSPEQWEALKALRNPAPRGRPVKTYVVEDLLKLGLVAIRDGVPEMTPTGRKVLVRGSCHLLDLVA